MCASLQDIEKYINRCLQLTPVNVSTVCDNDALIAILSAVTIYIEHESQQN